jgi:uncharacterized membrane protein
MAIVLGLVAFVVVFLAAVLPIVAIVRTVRITELAQRVAGLEAALNRLITQQSQAQAQTQGWPAAPQPVEPPKPVGAPAPVSRAVPSPQPPIQQPSPAPATPAAVEPPIVRDWQPRPRAPEPANESLETIIGRKWLGWVAILLIFGATVFFLKYAFDNRWIGELGRVVLGIAAGLAMVWAGYDRHRKQWRYLAQVLTSGGVIILYLSIYAAFGYYHLISQPAAFAFLVIIVAQAYLLALAYKAPSIVLVGIIGGFLVPVLLNSGRDQYVVFFTYIFILNAGTLGVVLARDWPWIASLSYLGTQALFWSWHSEHYHPDKQVAALLFQFAILALFVLADLANRRRGRNTGPEEWARMAVIPFAFYATCYYLLNEDHHDWMAALALIMAVVFAGIARWNLSLTAPDQRSILVAIGTALTFVTLAIPVQLHAHWITIAWGVEAAVLLWASWETARPVLRVFAGCIFVLAIYRFLILDTPESRAPFTPVLNHYFLGMLALVISLAAAAYVSGRRVPADNSSSSWTWTAGFAAFGVLLLGSSIEAYTYFSAQAEAMDYLSKPALYENVKSLHWAGQLSLSLLWCGYALLLTACGFRYRLRPLRTAGLALFGITLAKAVFVDIAELRAFYRIVALLALGLVLLGVAWTYQRVIRQEQAK